MSVQSQRCCGCWPLVPDQPCGCPQGTVRSTIAIFSVVTILFLLVAVIAVLLANQQWSLAGTIANGPTAIISAIISYYFASRQAQKNGQPVEEEVHLAPERDHVEVIGGNPD